MIFVDFRIIFSITDSKNGLQNVNLLYSRCTFLEISEEANLKKIQLGFKKPSRKQVVGNM